MLCGLNPRIYSAGIKCLSIGRIVSRGLSLQTRPVRYEKHTELGQYLKRLKIERFQCFKEANITKPCVEVLKTNHEELDVVHVRSRQPQVLYLRCELLLQRISFLKPIGITVRQKRKLIEKNPPVLILNYDTEGLEGLQVSFLRGLVRDKSSHEDRICHIFHPCSQMIVMRSYDLRNHVEYIQEQLDMAQRSALQLILNIPSFLIHNKSQMQENFTLIHKHMLPQGFDMDRHTAELYPPIYHRSDKRHPLVHTKLATEDMAASMMELSINDILDYSYKEDHGKGQPEDLNDFLRRAEARELRPKYNKVK